MPFTPPTSTRFATPPVDRGRPVRRLRVTATVLVALALMTAGGWKLFRPDPSVTMLSRYLPTPRAARAAGCLEIALALWLLSGRSPVLAPTVAAGALAGLGLLVGTELKRDQPLPCGCFPVKTTSQNTVAVRRELSVAIGRDAFLVLLCVMSGTLAPPPDED